MLDVPKGIHGLLRAAVRKHDEHAVAHRLHEASLRRCNAVRNESVVVGQDRRCLQVPMFASGRSGAADARDGEDELFHGRLPFRR